MNWCRGEAIVTDHNAGCALQYTKTIVGCFQENVNRLPGPPRNLKLEKLSDDEILVRWDPPVKNPKTIEGYRVFWHEADVNSDNFSNVIQGSNTTKLDAKDTSIKIGGLRHNVIYELVAKAGNHYGNNIEFIISEVLNIFSFFMSGASILSDPLRFSLDDQITTSSHTSSNAGVIGGIFAGIFSIFVIVAAFIFFRNRRSKKPSANGGVAFENPSYLKETNVEQVHVRNHRIK